MKAKDLDRKDVLYLKMADLENLFNVFSDGEGRYFYNLNETAYVNVPENSLQKYFVKYKMQWTLLSYAIYGTTRLAWLLMKVNDVRAEDMFKPIEPGDVVLYPPDAAAQSVTRAVNGY